MVKNVRNVNTFQQTAGNYARYGAFYTNTDMMYRCGRLLKIENEENKVTVVFEPHIGDGTAVTSLLRGAGAERHSIVNMQLKLTVIRLKSSSRQKSLIRKLMKRERYG